MRRARFALAVATLAAMGGVEGGSFRCIATGEWFAIGSVPVEVDRPRSGECYTLGNFVITTRNANQARNTQGDPSADWTSRYVTAVEAAAATVGNLTATECDRIWNEWHPTERNEAVTFGEVWF